MNKYTILPKDNCVGMDLMIPENRYAKILCHVTSDEGLHSILYIEGEYIMLTKTGKVFNWNPLPVPDELMPLAMSCAEHYI